MSSTRSRRTPTTAKVASSAPVSAPPRTSRRRKAAADHDANNDAKSDAVEEDDEKDDNDDDSSQVKQRSSKRQKRSPSSSTKKVTVPTSTTRIRGGTRKKQQQEDEEEEQKSDADMKEESPAASSRRKKKSVATTKPTTKKASRKSTRTKTNTKKKQVEDEDEDEEMAEEDNSNQVNLSPLFVRHEHDAKLNALNEPKYELLFARSTTTSTKIELVGETSVSMQSLRRPGLPKILTQHICDFLSIGSIGSRLAVISRSGYVTARSYAELVQTQLIRSQKQDPEGNYLLVVGGNDDEQKRRFEQDRVGIRGSEPKAPSLRCFNYRMLHSRLRGLLTEISSTYVINTPQSRTMAGYGNSSENTLPLPSEISFALPHLHTADLTIQSIRTSKNFSFPLGLRRLKLNFELKRKWNVNTMTQYLTRVLSGLKKLKYLNHLTIASYGWGALIAPHLAVFIDAITCLPNLRVLHSHFNNFLTSDVDTLRSLPLSLTDITEVGVQNGQKWSDSTSFHSYGFSAVHETKQKEFIAAITKAPLPFLSLQTFAFDRIMKTEYIPIYSSMASTLTSLEFNDWQTADVAWLSECTQLRTFSNCGIKSEIYNPYYRPPQPLNANVLLPIPQLVDTLMKCTHMTDLKLNLEKMTTFEFDQLLSSLTSLRQLQITSSEVYSIESFSKYEHLTRNLESLTISLPRVLRDDVVHLYSLNKLVDLNIESSFSEPLYSAQLIVLQGKTSRLPYIRTFVQRSPFEPVLPTPVTPEIRVRHLVEFDLRVKNGLVSSAEEMHADQLCLIFQFLDVGDFIRSARSCRTWNHAGSLPSAWPSCPKIDSGRRLTGRSRLREFTPSVLPHLPLFRHLRSLRFSIALEDFGSRYWQNEPMQANQAIRYREMINTLTLLTRLESLHLDMTEQIDNEPIERALATLSPHLHHFALYFSAAPLHYNPQQSRPRLSFVGSFSELVSLRIESPFHVLPNMDFSLMHQLERFHFGHHVSDLKQSGWLDQLRSLYLQKNRLRLIVSLSNNVTDVIDPTVWKNAKMSDE